MFGSTLLERNRELELLSGVVAKIPSTGGLVVLIRGEAGIGKSALVHELARSQGDGTHVHLGACDDLIIPQPLGPFWDMARAERSLMAPLERRDRPQLLQAVLDLLSRPSPTILVIEDTHWADEATLDAIRYIGRRINHSNGVLVLTYRDGDVDYDHPLRAVIGDIPAQSVMRIQLTGLSLPAVSTLVADSGLDPTEILRATRGNPFLVKEMSSAAGAGGTGSLHDSVMARVRKLTAGSQEMLRTLSVVPEPIPTSDASRIDFVDDDRLDECVQRGLLELHAGAVSFRHELIRRTIESSLAAGERVARNRSVLDALPEAVYPSLLMHCAVEAGAVERLLDLAPRSARYAAAMGSHVQAARDFRELEPYLERLDSEAIGPLLEEWAREEHLIDNIPEAIRLNRMARARYRDVGDRSSESRALVWAVQWHEAAGEHHVAGTLAHEAVTALGPDDGEAPLARALEVNAYLRAMAGDVSATLDFVERTIQVGGEGIDDNVLIRSLSHKGYVLNIAGYPQGSPYLDEARDRAAAVGNWYEAARALSNHGWGAAEHHDLSTARDLLQEAIAVAARHELLFVEGLAKAEYARMLEMRGDWTEAGDRARELQEAATATRLLALPVVGQIEARRGRPTAWSTLSQAWEMASGTDEFHRLAPCAIALAEHAWISGQSGAVIGPLLEALAIGVAQGYRWSTGKLALRLWMLGELADPPPGIAEPYRALMEGDAAAAAAVFEVQGVPYERALALMHGSESDQLEALRVLESLDAGAVAAKHRRALRERGIAVPRGKGRETRRHGAGLTARQAEVLGLLAEGLTNHEIADRLFVSPRTAEHHVSAVLDKLDASTREEAVARARSEGLMPTPTDEREPTTT